MRKIEENCKKVLKIEFGEKTIEAHKKRTATNLAKSRNYSSPLIEYFRLG